MKLKALLFVFAMVLLVPAGAFAGEKNSVNIQLDQPVQVAGTQLVAGHYKMTWEGTGPDVTVSFLEGRKTVATAPAKLENANPAGDSVALEMSSAPGNTQVLRAVDVKKLSIRFEEAVPTSGN
jgi:hypothetical protein